MGNGFLQNGFIERKKGGSYDGTLTVEGIDLSPISAQYFKDEGDSYLWLKRKQILDYDFETQSYKSRDRKPYWECYLKKQIDGKTVSYKGEFTFMHFKFSIRGVWDSVLGTDDKQRLNLFVERLPMSQQVIINNINERKKNDAGKRFQ